MRIRDENLILADASQVRVHGEVYPDITLTDLIRSLLLSPGFTSRSLSLPKTATKEAPPCRSELTSQMIVKELNSFIRDDMVVVTDVGDCLFSCLDLQVNKFIAPAFYASVGFGVPAGIGVGLADPTRRPVILVGDGGFQMTGVELCTAKKLEQNPIVIVFDDGCYGTLRAFGPELKSFELAGWDYVTVGKALGCDGSSASTPLEFRDSLKSALESKLPFLIDVKITGSPSPLLSRLAELVGKKTGGNPA